MDEGAGGSPAPGLPRQAEPFCQSRSRAADWADRLLRPSTVAVVGASADPRKPGGAIFENLCRSAVRVYPINPRASHVAGRPCFASVLDVPDEVDMAVVAVPADVVSEVVDHCAQKGVGVIVVVSGGLGETGEAGKRAERRMAEAALSRGSRILGPNTVGVYVPGSRLDTTFIPGDRWQRPPVGPIALVCQSGALGLDAAELCSAYGVGISAMVSLGNKCDLNERDLVEALARDPSTRCIALYLESLTDGRAFVDVCRRVSPEKPIVVTKAGRSEAGARAAALHTGALAGSDRVLNGVLKQVGVVRAYDVGELVDSALALTYGRPLHRPRLAVLSCAGGYAVTLADYLTASERGLGASLAVLSERTVHRLREVTVPFAALENPIDLTGSVTNAAFNGALEALEQDPNVDAIVVSLVPYPPLLDEGVVDVLERWHRQGSKPLVTVVTGLVFGPRVLRRLWRAGALAYPTPWQAVRALDVLCQRGEYLRRLAESGR